MNIIFILIPLALILMLVALGIFFWALRTKQFDNLDVEARRVIFDDVTKKIDKKN